MIAKTTEELTEITKDKVEKSGLNHSEILEKINQNREKSDRKKLNSISLISHAIQNSKKSDTSVNGIRREILTILGFTVNLQFEIKREKNY